MAARRDSASAIRILSALAERKAASAIMNHGTPQPGAIYPLPWSVVAKAFEIKTGQPISEQWARETGSRAIKKARERAAGQIIVVLD